MLPYGFVRWAVGSVNREGHPAVIYIHPWELDPEQPRIEADLFSKFKHYVNIDKTKKKLENLLDDFSFKPIRYFLDKEGKNEE